MVAKRLVTTGWFSENVMTYEKRGGNVDWLALWILFSAWSSLSGWGLSVFRWLNPAGIAFSYVLFFGGLVLFRSQLQGGVGRIGWRRFRSRFWAPRIWLALAVLACVGGIAYAPSNYDFLTYRFTRVLNWSWNEGWGWIPTVNERMNYSGTGFEWLMTPLFVVFKTDRLFFLINFISYLLLPGVIFSVFSHLGIGKRISWWWMWVLPCGYGYILEAASVGNDFVAVLYFLASLHYLFQAKDSSSVKNPALSCLAIALMTGVKISNLPLVLPWLTLLFFRRSDFSGKWKPAMVAVILMVSADISFLPIALINLHFTGDYAGDPDNHEKQKLSNPVSALLGNSLELAKDNLAPPLLPRSFDWDPLLPSDFRAKLLRDFPRFNLHLGELPIEEDAGMGLGIVLFACLFVVGGIRARVGEPGLAAVRNNQAVWVAGAGAVALLVYMAKVGGEAPARLIAAYYPLLIAGILALVSLDGRMVRRPVFKWVGHLAMLSALPVVILCPARPLFPVQVVSRLMVASHVPAGMITRYNQVYRTYAERADAFRELTALIPPGERIIGFLQNGDDSEAALWRPFGTRKVVDVTPGDSAEGLKARGIHFVVVGQDALTNHYHTTAALLAAKWSASAVAEESLVLKAHLGPETWYLFGIDSKK
jgi:hypothetical protein